MISFNHNTDEKAESDTTIRPPFNLRERERHGHSWQTDPPRENVTSSAAIAPGCLSARWEGGRKGERHKERQGGMGQEQREERDTKTWVCGNKPKPGKSLRQQWKHRWPHLRLGNRRRGIITVWQPTVNLLHLPWQQMHADAARGERRQKGGGQVRFIHGNGA